MWKTILGGIIVGIANIIPGVSGGTMLVILGLFNPLMSAIANFVKHRNPNRLQDFLFLLQIFIGAAAGLVGFANIIGYLFANFYVGTMFCFIALIVLSVPALVKTELQGKLSLLCLLAGSALVAGIVLLSPMKDVSTVPETTLTIGRLLMLTVLGMISGAVMILPGVSGSMILLILGEYEYFRYLIANVMRFEVAILLQLSFIGIGVLLGILLLAKLMQYWLKANRQAMISFILGLVITSAVALIPMMPLDVTYLVSAGSGFIIGVCVILGLGKLRVQ